LLVDKATGKILVESEMNLLMVSILGPNVAMLFGVARRIFSIGVFRNQYHASNSGVKAWPEPSLTTSLKVANGSFPALARVQQRNKELVDVNEMLLLIHHTSSASDSIVTAPMLGEVSATIHSH
jgi:hypothetical protein